jgi:hypothetical protein
MVTHNTQLQLLSQFNNGNLFEFKNKEYNYVFVGYPYWRAFILTPKSNLRLEVFTQFIFQQKPTSDTNEERV